MKTFKRKTFNTAVLAALGVLGVAGSAEAVQLSQDGTGAALIYPYYTVRNNATGPYFTTLNVVNTTNSAKVVKVRFLEGKNSREVLDFNLWLSAHDVWAGQITQTAAGAKLTSGDESCVTTAGGVTRSIAAGSSFDFSNTAYGTGAAQANNMAGVDGGDTSLDRTREGYVEIIEMGVVIGGTPLEAGVTHNAQGRPANCAVIPTTPAGAVGKLVPGTGGLFGGASLINAGSGADFAVDAVAFEDFNTASTLFFEPGSISPTLNNAAPVSKVFYYHQNAVGAFETTVVNSDFSLSPVGLFGADAVSSVLERTSVANTYILDAATLSQTDWVMTFPTKRFYIQPKQITPAVNNNIRPFGTSYAEFDGTSCGAYSLRVYDREEQTPGITTTQVSPPVPGVPPNSLCYESTVLNFFPAGTTTPTPVNTLLGSTNGSTAPAPFEHGWAKAEFGTYDGSGVFTAAYTNLPDTQANPNTFHGLPVVGFMVHDYINNGVVIGGVTGRSYAGNFNHKYTRYITSSGANSNLPSAIISNAPSQY